MVEDNEKRENVAMNASHSVLQYKWIEKLLETPIEDGRKYALWKILCPIKY